MPKKKRKPDMLKNRGLATKLSPEKAQNSCTYADIGNVLASLKTA
jgi:hypothetical protein